jgi:hypothetical protein
MSAEFSIEKGEYGQRLVLNAGWSDQILDYMLAHDIKEVNINYARGFTGQNVDFLTKVPFLAAILIIVYHTPNLQAINSLHNLRSLSIGGQEKVQIDFANFPQLVQCALMRKIKTKGLFECTTLRDLYLNPYSAKDTSNLAALSNIESLRLISAPAVELNGLRHLEKLTKLEISYFTKLPSLSGIEYLTGLESLEINACRKLTNIEEVKELRNLKRFVVANCDDIASLKPLEHLDKLEKVIFNESTNIVDGDLSPLENLPHLKLVAFRNRKHYSHTQGPNADNFRSK